VAEAFKNWIPRSKHPKNGLRYPGAFDGHEAVSVIADIIKTADRYQAFLVGRALEDQLFIHNVTYGLRLKDSEREIYQLRLGAEFLCADDGRPYVDDDQASIWSWGEEPTIPTGVFTLLTGCYSPTCTGDRPCYSFLCRRRLEQQAL
jgi:hypothetical protein